MIAAIAATICASGLVFFLQHNAISALHTQTGVILRQISEQTASDIAAEIRQTLDGPVFDTLTAVNHPELRAGRLDLVAQQFQEGLRDYPHVDRFLAWHAKTDDTAPGEVVFYGRDGRFQRDPSLGRAVMALAERYAPAQQIYVAAEGVGDQRARQVFLRLFWTDAERVRYFAILGFVVEPSRMREQLFGPSRRAHLESLLGRRGGDVPLQLRVTDEDGNLVYGTAVAGTPGSRVAVPMTFYPADEIESRLAARVEPHVWSIEVNAALPSAGLARVSQEYGPTGITVLLILVALGLTMQAQRRSAELGRMQADFIAHVSHQLKTPLSLLSTATETLQMDRVKSPERLAEYLGTIHAEASRLSMLVQRVLEFSRVQQRRTYEFERIDLAALARESVDAFAHSLGNHRFTFDVQADGPGPYVKADPAALEQVLVNLLDNAVKYSDSSQVIAVRVSDSARHAVVEIIDRGIGIGSSDCQRIFERFYRASGGPHRPGFGLGLSIVRELVHAHRGRVEVSSVLGQGSTFRVTLPRDVPKSVRDDQGSVGVPEGVS